MPRSQATTGQPCSAGTTTRVVRLPYHEPGCPISRSFFARCGGRPLVAPFTVCLGAGPAGLFVVCAWFPGLRPRSANLFGMFFSKLPQNRHPEWSASQIYRVAQRLVARSRRACPELSRGNPEGAYLAHAACSFSTTEAHTWRTRHGLWPRTSTASILLWLPATSRFSPALQALSAEPVRQAQGRLSGTKSINGGFSHPGLNPQHPFLHFAKIADCNRSRSPAGNS